MSVQHNPPIHSELSNRFGSDTISYSTHFDAVRHTIRIAATKTDGVSVHSKGFSVRIFNYSLVSHIQIAGAVVDIDLMYEAATSDHKRVACDFYKNSSKIKANYDILLNLSRRSVTLE